MKTKEFTRRDFLKAAGVAVAATTITCSGLGYVASRAPQIEAPEFHLTKDNPMKNRILIAYATRAGSTAEIGAALGENLYALGFEVDVTPVKANPSLEGYDAVILGSAIRMANWLPEAVDFIKTNQSELSALPLAFFTAHLMNTGEDEASRASRLAYLDTVRGLISHPVEEVYFAGKMDYAKLSFLDRTISKMIKSEEADRRDWEQIRNWVPQMVPEIQ